jgi:amino acid transporter
MPGEVAAHLPSQNLFLCAWFLGGVNALMGATVFAELGTMIPLSGGLYTFARRAFGDYGAFLVGYSDWLNQTITVSLWALVVGEYSRGFLPGFEGMASQIAFGKPDSGTDLAAQKSGSLGSHCFLLCAQPSFGHTATTS